MTPAIELLKKSQVPHEVLSYHHDPKAASYGLEAAEKLGLAPETVFKTRLREGAWGQGRVCVGQLD